MSQILYNVTHPLRSFPSEIRKNVDMAFFC